jgi:hypothetical protein
MATAADYAESRAGTISFAVVDEGGRLHGYRARTVAPSASVLKAMLLVAYLRRADVRERNLAPWERSLLGPMIRRSDNVAATLMIGLVGEWRLRKLATLAGMEHFRLHMPIWGASEITPRGQAIYFHRIDALVPARHRSYGMHLLATVIPSQRWGAGRVSHAGWRLFFKGGWGSGTGLVDHQVALYKAAGERFSLALFTLSNPDHEYGKETLRGLATRLLAGVAHPLGRLARAARVSVRGGYVVTASRNCRTVSIRPLVGRARALVSGAARCRGFKLVSAGERALWSWASSGSAHLATAAYGDSAATDLGTFSAPDPLGALAAGGSTLAYQHGSSARSVGGPDCPAPGEALLATGHEGLAVAAAGVLEVIDPTTCGLVQSFTSAGEVTALALGDDLLVSLSRGDSGRLWLVRYRISTGERLGRAAVPGATLPTLALRGPWILSRSAHALRAAAAASGRSWTVWRPRRSPVGAGFVGHRFVWIENRNGASRLWTLRLPPAA